MKISGMHCLDCAHTVAKALSSVRGVAHAEVSYLKKRAEVEGQEGLAVEELVAAVQEAGYGAEVLADEG